LNEFASSAGNRIDDHSLDAFRSLQDSWEKDGDKIALWTYWHDFRDVMLTQDHRQVW
jgi:hypothetical protein